MELFSVKGQSEHLYRTLPKSTEWEIETLNTLAEAGLVSKPTPSGVKVS